MAPDNDIAHVEQRLTDHIDELAEKIVRMDESLRGNGQPGILTRMAVMDERMTALTSLADEVQGFKRWVVFGVVSLIASMLVQSLGLLP